MTQFQLLSFVSQVSAWLGEETCTVSETHIMWIVKRSGELILDLEENELQFVDCNLDTKTYWALIAYAASLELTTEDYFTEKTKK